MRLVSAIVAARVMHKGCNTRAFMLYEVQGRGRNVFESIYGVSYAASTAFLNLRSVSISSVALRVPNIFNL